MPNIGDVTIGVGVDATDVPKQLKKQLAGAGEAAGAIIGTGLKVAAGAAATGIGIALAAGFAKGFGRLRDIDNAKSKLEGLKFSAEQVQSVMDSALKSVKGTAYGLGEAATVASIFGATGVKAGEQMTRALKLTADAATVGGTSLTDMGDVLSEVSALGKVTGDTLNRMGERGIDALGSIATSFGVTREEARDMVSEGEVSFEEFAAAMEANIGGAALKSGETFDGAMANIGAAIGRVGAEALGPLFEAMKSIAPEVITSIDSMSAAFQPIFDEVGPGVADVIGNIGDAIGAVDWGAVAGNIQGAWGVIAAIFQGIYDVVESVVNIFQPGLEDAVRGVGDALGGIPWADIAAGIKGVFGWVADHGDILVAVLAGISGAVLAGLVPAFTAWAFSIWLLVPAIWASTVALLASPITWIVVGIGLVIAAIVLLILHWDEVVKFITDTWSNFMDWITPVLEGFAEWWTGIWEGIVGFFTDVWEGLVSFFTPIWNFIAGLVKFYIDIIVNYFRFWAAVAMWLWEHAIQPALDAIGKAFEWLWQNAIQPVIDFIVLAIEGFGIIMDWLWKEAIQPVMDALGVAFNWLWQNVIMPNVALIQAALQVLGGVFEWLYENVITPVWEGIQSVLQAGWTWINTNVFDPFKRGIELLALGFEIAKSAIAKTWEGIKKAAAVPINFVLDTIWNNGLRSFWNGMVRELGLPDMQLPKAQLVSFAKGGVLPGYTPGRDVHHFFSPTGGRLDLSGGEGIIRPDALRRLGGKKWLDAVNKGRGTGDGGGLIGDSIDFLAEMGGVIWDFFSDPKAAIQKHVIDRLITSQLGGQNIFGKTIGGLAANTMMGFVKMFEDAAPQVKAGKGMGWEAMWAIVKRFIPGATLNDALRPAGTTTAGGGQSYHGLGRAIDIGPANMA
ncbi:MAG TPA: tape measure protein, partial [Mycobacterium sp.]